MLRLLVILAFLYLSWIWIRAVIEGIQGKPRRKRKKPSTPSSGSGSSRPGHAAERLIPCQVCGVHVVESRLLPDSRRGAGDGWCSETCRRKTRIAS